MEERQNIAAEHPKLVNQMIKYMDMAHEQQPSFPDLNIEFAVTDFVQ